MEMLTLLLMRHAKASWDHPGVSDHDRPLDAQGRQAAPRMGQLLREQGLLPELIVSSTARRAVETAQAVATSSGYEGRLEITRRLYLAEPDSYLDLLTEVDHRLTRVLIVGHNPGITQLVTLLSGVDEAMSTAAVAQIELPGERFSQVVLGQGTLRAMFRPDGAE